MSSADLHAPTSTCRFEPGLRFGPPFLLRPPGFDGFLLVPLGNGTLGRRVAPHSAQFTIS